jgi:hypothetical protein
VEYWDNPKAPHPDLLEPTMAKSGRTLAPFQKGKTAHYCHHYRQTTEHYHASMQELERCSL